MRVNYVAGDIFITERSLYNLGADIAVVLTAFDYTVGHLLLITNVLGTLIKHASEVAIMLFGGSVRRQTVHGAVLDAGCNTNAA